MWQDLTNGVLPEKEGHKRPHTEDRSDPETCDPCKDPPWLHSNSILYTHVTRLMLWYVQPICFFSNPVGESVSGLSVPT